MINNFKSKYITCYIGKKIYSGCLCETVKAYFLKSKILWQVSHSFKVLLVLDGGGYNLRKIQLQLTGIARPLIKDKTGIQSNPKCNRRILYKIEKIYQNCKMLGFRFWLRTTNCRVL